MIDEIVGFGGLIYYFVSFGYLEWSELNVKHIIKLSMRREGVHGLGSMNDVWTCIYNWILNCKSLIRLTPKYFCMSPQDLDAHTYTYVSTALMKNNKIYIKSGKESIQIFQWWSIIYNPPRDS